MVRIKPCSLAVLLLALAGCGAKPEVFMSVDKPDALMADGDFLYFNMFDASSAGAGRVVKVPRTGGPMVTLGQALTLGMIADAQTLYWEEDVVEDPAAPRAAVGPVDGKGDVVQAARDAAMQGVTGVFGRIMAVAKSGGKPRVVASRLGTPRWMAQDETHLYIADLGPRGPDLTPPRGKGMLWKISKGGGEP